MVAPIIWGGLVLGGLVASAWAADETGDALDSATRLAKWATVAGGVYVSYKALQASGAIR